jgi:hypothetical protein
VQEGRIRNSDRVSTAKLAEYLADTYIWRKIKGFPFAQHTFYVLQDLTHPIEVVTCVAELPELSRTARVHQRDSTLFNATQNLFNDIMTWRAGIFRSVFNYMQVGVRQRCLYWARRLQSMPSNHICLGLILILSSHLTPFLNGVLPPRCTVKVSNIIIFCPELGTSSLPHHLRFRDSKKLSESAHCRTPQLRSFLYSPVPSSTSGPDILSRLPFSVVRLSPQSCGQFSSGYLKVWVSRQETTI